MAWNAKRQSRKLRWSLFAMSSGSRMPGAGLLKGEGHNPDCVWLEGLSGKKRPDRHGCMSKKSAQAWPTDCHCVLLLSCTNRTHLSSVYKAAAANMPRPGIFCAAPNFQQPIEGPLSPICPGGDMPVGGFLCERRSQRPTGQRQRPLPGYLAFISAIGGSRASSRPTRCSP